MIRAVIRDIIRLRGDKEGIYVILFMVMLGFVFVPAMAVLFVMNDSHMAFAEAQIVTDGAGLAIVNDSSLDFQDFQTTNQCNEVTYRGTEYYLDYVGDARAYSELENIFKLNKKYLSSIESYKFVVRDRYQPASNTNARIPESIKSEKHDPVLELVVTYKYNTIVPNFIRNPIVTRTTVVEKGFDADTAREEYNYDAPLACLHHNDDSSDGDSSNSGGTYPGGFNLDDVLNGVRRSGD